jgi:hypothetical protein
MVTAGSCCSTAATVWATACTVVWSNDDGETWSEPQPIFLTNNDDKWPAELKIVQDTSSNYHAVWALGDISGNSSAVYYAQYDAEAKNG